jgi:putative ABC transport system substrate-binding protein
VRRRTFTLQVGSTLVMPSATIAQLRGKPFTVGGLGASSPESSAAVVAAFHKAMRELGYVEGSNIRYEYRWAYGIMDRLPGFAAELAALPVDVIVAGNNPSIAAAQRATSTIPIVMIAVDPVRNGFVKSLTRPEGNITGLTNDPGQQMQGKILALVKEILPHASIVGVLAQHGLGYDRSAVESAASSLDLRLDLNDSIRTPDEVEAAFNAMVRRRVDAYFMIGGPVLFAQRKRIGELALAHRLPGVHWVRDWVDAGGLLSYGTKLEDLYVRAATYIDKIAKGAKPAELPVELPSRFHLVVNRRTARSLGLTIPQSVLLRADDVVD